MCRKLLLLALGCLLVNSIGRAGIVRHVIKPVVKTGAHVAAKSVKTVAHGVKTVAY